MAYSKAKLKSGGDKASPSFIPLRFPSLRSIIQIISPCPRLLVNFRNKIIFYGEELLAPCPTPKLEDHPLSAVRDCLFNILYTHTCIDTYIHTFNNMWNVNCTYWQQTYHCWLWIRQMTDPSFRQRERPISTSLQSSDSNQNLVLSPRWVLYSKTDWPTDSQS
jgi:hypothetical protein